MGCRNTARQVAVRWGVPMEACLAGPCIHVMLNHAPIVFAEKAYNEQLHVAKINMSVFEPASTSGRAQHIACCMMCRGGVVPKEVNNTMGTIKTEIGDAEMMGHIGHKFDLMSCTPCASMAP
jgi:hypothetical protein